MFVSKSILLEWLFFTCNSLGVHLFSAQSDLLQIIILQVNYILVNYSAHSLSPSHHLCLARTVDNI